MVSLYGKNIDFVEKFDLTLNQCKYFISSLGTNILPQAIVVEQLFSQQWHWIAKNNNSKNLFM
jgi:hypothetical protein